MLPNAALQGDVEAWGELLHVIGPGTVHILRL